jgi:hypothetical protein
LRPPPRNRGVPVTSAGLILLHALAPLDLATLAPGFEVSIIFNASALQAYPSPTPKAAGKRIRFVATTTPIQTQQTTSLRIPNSPRSFTLFFISFLHGFSRLFSLSNPLAQLGLRDGASSRSATHICPPHTDQRNATPLSYGTNGCVLWAPIMQSCRVPPLTMS